MALKSKTHTLLLLPQIHHQHHQPRLPNALRPAQALEERGGRLSQVALRAQVAVVGGDGLVCVCVCVCVCD
jgi:hypothetical protein